jgi:hypothetical protein
MKAALIKKKESGTEVLSYFCLASVYNATELGVHIYSG